MQIPVNFVFCIHSKPRGGRPMRPPLSSQIKIRSFLVVVLAVRVAAGTVLTAVVGVVVRTVLRVVLVVLVLLLLILLAVLVKIILRHLPYLLIGFMLHK